MADLLTRQSELTEPIEAILTDVLGIDERTVAAMRQQFYQQVSLEHCPSDQLVFQT